jgi:hypothetical protein
MRLLTLVRMESAVLALQLSCFGLCFFAITGRAGFRSWGHSFQGRNVLYGRLHSICHSTRIPV